MSKVLCLNCDAALEKAKLFCSDRCSDEAKLVRYVRRCREDGRDEKPDVREAIHIRVAHILAGGYPERERELSKSTRLQVVTRAGGRCQQCGEPGTQVDHISGSSNDPKNLQLLCRKCHSAKTKSAMVPLSPDDDDFIEYVDKIVLLTGRFDAPKPTRICDDHERWPTAWKAVLLQREQAWGTVS
jgi:5-methylcytosine-specific restriction endonuclease McrA